MTWALNIRAQIAADFRAAQRRRVADDVRDGLAEGLGGGGMSPFVYALATCAAFLVGCATALLFEVGR
jgi:hypothetical protein